MEEECVAWNGDTVPPNSVERQGGVRVRQCQINAQADFEKSIIKGNSVTDVTFPIDFGAATYAQVWDIFVEREDKESGGRPPPADRPRSLAACIDSTESLELNPPDTVGPPLPPPKVSPSLCLAFHSPHTNVCSVTSIMVNGVRSSFSISSHINPQLGPRVGIIPLSPGDRRSISEFDAEIASYIGEQWATDLLIALPVRVLRMQLQRAYLAVKTAQEKVHQENVQMPGRTWGPSVPAERLPVGNMAFSLSVDVHFCLNRPRPTNSSIYFVTKMLRSTSGDDMHEYPMLVTSQQVPSPSGQAPWFPSVPYKVFNQTDSKGRFHYRVHWKQRYMVPSTYACLAPGYKVSQRRVVMDGRAWDVHEFETRGELSTLLPSQIAFFAAPMKVLEGEDSSLSPFNVTIALQAESALPTKNTKRRDDEEEEEDDENDQAEDDNLIGVWEPSAPISAAGPISTPNRPDALAKDLISVNVREPTAKAGKAYFAVPPLMEHMLRVSISHLPRAIRLVQENLRDQGALQQGFTLAFLPVGNNRPWFESGLAQKRSNIHSGEQEVTPSMLSDDANGGLPPPRAASVPNMISYGSRFWVFGNLVVMDTSLLHSHAENHEGIRFAKLSIVEGILALWFGNLLDVLPTKLSEDLWLSVALRKYYTFRVHMELFGRVDATLLLHRIRADYVRAVELGQDRLPLSASPKSCLSVGPLLDYHPIFQMKCFLILPALECLLVSTSNGRNWLSAQFLKQTVSGYINRLLQRYPKSPLTTDKFFDRIIHRAKAAFIKAKHHINAVTASEQAATEPIALGVTPLPPPTPMAPKGPITPSQLKPQLYRGHPHYDIGEWIDDVISFQRSYINGTGCPQVTIAMFCEMQKKTFTLDSLRVRINEISLQPPCEILAKEDVSHFWGAVFGSVGTLSHLLQSPELINFVIPPEGTAPPGESPSGAPINEVSPGDAAIDQLRTLLMQCASPLACLDQMKFSLDGTIYDPVELIVRDNRCVLGFGYLGCTTSAICGGRGPLFNSLVKQASNTWSNLSPEQRSVMASDTAAMEALVSSSVSTGVVRIASGATGGQPDWIPDVLSWQMYRDAVTLQEVTPTNIRNPSQFSDFCWTRGWIEGTLAQYRMAPMSSFFKKEFYAELPESAGNAKFWPHALRLLIYEDTKISDAQISLRGQILPIVYTIRDNTGAGPGGGIMIGGVGNAAGTPVAAGAGLHLIAGGSGSRIRGGNNSLVPRVLGIATASASSGIGEVFRFMGSLQPQGDVDLLQTSCTEAVRALFSAGSLRQPGAGLESLLAGAVGEEGGSTVEGGGQPHGARPGQRSAANQRALPLLWTRPSEDSFGLVRLRRFQSLSMWTQQMLNDVDPLSQLEAVEAVGACGDSPHALAALRTFVNRARVHPYIRGMTAAALSKLSRKDFGTSPEAARILIEEVLENMKSPAGSLTAVAKEVAKDTGTGRKETTTGSSQLLALFASQFGPGSGQKWMPPLYSSHCMQFLQYLYHSISQVRDLQDETPEQVYTLIRDCLESLPSPVDLRVDLSNFSRTEDSNCLDLTPLSCDHTLSISSFICTVVYEVSNLALPQVPNLDAIFPFESGPECIQSDPDSSTLWSFKWMNENAQALFLSIWRWVRMEQKFVNGPQLVTRSFLRLIGQVPSYALLTRFHSLQDTQLPFDPLRLFIPLRVILPGAIVTSGLLPSPLPETSAFMYLHQFVLAATGLLENPALITARTQGEEAGVPHEFWAELVRAVSYASHCLNYLDINVMNEALRVTLSLILQGRLLPPPYLLTRSAREIVETEAPPAPDWIFMVDTLYLLPETETQSPLSSIWIDDFSRQQMLMRSGTAVYAAIRLLCQLEALLPFSDMTEFVSGAWTIMHQCLETATKLSPLALMPFCLTSPLSHAPLLNPNMTPSGHGYVSVTSAGAAEAVTSVGPKRQKKDKTTEKATQKRKLKKSSRRAGASVAATGAAAPKIVVPRLSDENELLTSSELDPTELQTNPSAASIQQPQLPVEASLLDEMLNNEWASDDGGVGGDEDWVAEFGFGQGLMLNETDAAYQLPQPSAVGADSQLTPSDLMGEPSDVIERTEMSEPTFMREGEHSSAMPETIPYHSGTLENVNVSEEVSGSLPARGPGDLSTSRPHKKHKKKKARKSRESVAPPRGPFAHGIPVIVSPVIMSFELAYRYLHVVAAGTVATALIHVWSVREVIRFLFGDGVPKPIAICNTFLDAWRAQAVTMEMENEFKSLEAYLATDLMCLWPVTHQYSRSAAKLAQRATRAGVVARQIPAFERAFINVWNLSQKPQSWPLPLQINWRSLALRLTMCLVEHPSGHWFIHPVDANTTPNYYKVIEHPMWLNKCIEQLKKREYGNFEQWKSDLFRIFRNCRTYNQPTSGVIADCDLLQSLAYQLLHFAERLLMPYDATQQ